MVRALLSILLLGASAVLAERYTFDFTKPFDEIEISQESQRLTTRQLQTAEEPCHFRGANLVCRYGFEIDGDQGVTQVLFQAECDADSQVGFDYRNAQNCRCMAQVKSPDPDSPDKFCPCTVCQAGFGETPINVDCTQYENTNTTTTETTDPVATTKQEVTDSVSIPDSVTLDTTTAAPTAVVANETLTDPFVVNSCTSIDCSGSCNGTCALNCANSETSCLFCENAAANQPTATPTGGGPSFTDTFGDVATPTGGLSSSIDTLTSAVASVSHRLLVGAAATVLAILL